MAAATVSIAKRLRLRGDLGVEIVVGTWVPNAAVAAGGDTYTDAGLKLNKVYYLNVGNATNEGTNDAGYYTVWDPANRSVAYFEQAGAAEFTGDLSALTFNFIAVGEPSGPS